MIYHEKFTTVKCTFPYFYLEKINCGEQSKNHPKLSDMKNFYA